ESVLGDICNFLVLGSSTDVSSAISLLKESKKGRATLIPADRIPTTSETHPRSIAHQVTCEKKWVPLRNLLLGSIVIIEDGETPDDGLTGVTLSGDVVTRESFIRTGSANASTGIRTSLKDKIM